MPTSDRHLETGPQRRIALVAHDGRKQDMREWADYNRDLLACHRLYATGTTGRMLGDELGLPAACNRASADYLISSPLMGTYAAEPRPASN